MCSLSTMFFLFTHCTCFFYLIFGQSYELIETHSGNTFFDGFLFESHDGTFSDFITNETIAKQMGLINTTNSTAYIGTDYWNKVGSNGRPAIQIGSVNRYSNGLFILNVSHMPTGCCVWPAWWLCGPDWPNEGEIDIIEGTNLATDDISHLHTGKGCNFMNVSVNMTGEYGSWCDKNCTTVSNSSHDGCGIWAENNNSYGIQFNNNNGGIYVAEVNDNIGIRLWFWTQSNVPIDIINKQPNPNTWSIPFAYWPFGMWCTSDHVKDLQMIFDLYYCGGAATDSKWNEQCGNIVGNATCEEFVMNNPSYFKDAYWLINYVDIYQMHSNATFSSKYTFNS
eukprot:523061_1